jgi:outer membrane lipoprotein-sorting protein
MWFFLAKMRIRSLSILGLAVLALRALPQPAPGDDAFRQIFTKTMARREMTKSIRAHFTETTTSSLLQKPLVAHGTIVAAPPARVLMTYTDPEKRYVFIDPKSLVVFWPDRGQRERIDISQTQKRIDHYFAKAGIDDLRSMFTIVVSGDPALRNTDRVEMRPKRKQIKDGLELLQLWIDRDTLLLAQMSMQFPGGDVKVIRLDDMAVNVPVTEASFEIPR